MKTSIKDLRNVFTYQPDTGEIFRTGGPLGSGKSAVVNDGKRRRLFVVFHGRKILAHRLAWAIHSGEWPKFEIDHINCDESDNRITNLRDVTKSVNQQNKRTPRSDNKTGFLGVKKSTNSNRFIAQITVLGKVKYLGIFKTPEEAHSVYLTAKRLLHPGCTL